MGSCTVELVNVTKYFGDELILQNVSCALPAASVVMLTGQNGAGTSLMVNTGEQWVTPENGLVSTIAWGLDNKVVYATE